MADSKPIHIPTSLEGLVVPPNSGLKPRNEEVDRERFDEAMRKQRTKTDTDQQKNRKHEQEETQGVKDLIKTVENKVSTEKKDSSPYAVQAPTKKFIPPKIDSSKNPAPISKSPALSPKDLENISFDPDDGIILHLNDELSPSFIPDDPVENKEKKSSPFSLFSTKEEDLPAPLTYQNPSEMKTLKEEVSSDTPSKIEDSQVLMSEKNITPPSPNPPLKRVPEPAALKQVQEKPLEAPAPLPKKDSETPLSSSSTLPPSLPAMEENRPEAKPPSPCLPPPAPSFSPTTQEKKLEGSSQTDSPTLIPQEKKIATSPEKQQLDPKPLPLKIEENKKPEKTPPSLDTPAPQEKQAPVLQEAPAPLPTLEKQPLEPNELNEPSLEKPIAKSKESPLPKNTAPTSSETPKETQAPLEEVLTQKPATKPPESEEEPKKPIPLKEEKIAKEALAPTATPYKTTKTTTKESKKVEEIEEEAAIESPKRTVAETQDKDQEERKQKEEEIPSITFFASPSNLATILSSPPSAYTSLPGPVFELFTEIVGTVLVKQMKKDLSDTVFTLNGSAFNTSIFFGCQITIKAYDQAKNIFNIKLSGSAAAIEQFTKHKEKLEKAFKDGFNEGKLTFQVHLIEVEEPTSEGET